MKFIVFTVLLLSLQLLIAQAGINTKAPEATLDIVAKYPSGSLHTENKEGLLIPRIDRARAKSMGDNLPLTEESTLVYINNVKTGSATGSAINITKKGFYYFSEKKNWIAFGEADHSVNSDNMITAQLTVPSYQSPDIDSHSVLTYDNNNWWLISKRNISSQKSFAQQEIEYKYQGIPLYTENLQPQLTVVNSNNYGQIISGTIISVTNSGTSGKTRLRVAVNRIDSAEGWQDTLKINVLIIAVYE